MPRVAEPHVEELSGTLVVRRVLEGTLGHDGLLHSALLMDEREPDVEWRLASWARTGPSGAATLVELIDRVGAIGSPDACVDIASDVPEPGWPGWDTSATLEWSGSVVTIAAAREGSAARGQTVTTQLTFIDPVACRSMLSLSLPGWHRVLDAVGMSRSAGGVLILAVRVDVTRWGGGWATWCMPEWIEVAEHGAVTVTELPLTSDGSPLELAGAGMSAKGRMLVDHVGRGFPDVVIGVPGAEQDQGAVYIVDGCSGAVVDRLVSTSVAGLGFSLEVLEDGPAAAPLLVIGAPGNIESWSLHFPEDRPPEVESAVVLWRPPSPAVFVGSGHGECGFGASLCRSEPASSGAILSPCSRTSNGRPPAAAIHVVRLAEAAVR
jgi:hypothetical protein